MTTLAECFEEFTDTAWRLETRMFYTGSGDAERLEAFLQHRPRPERSVRTSPWLARMARTSVEGKEWGRCHIVTYPLTAYLEMELVSYQESAVAGEQITIADRDAHPQLAALTSDFWLFDATTDHARLVLMDYREDGGLANSAVSTDPDAIATAVAQHDLALRYAVPLAEFLANRETIAA